MVADKNNNYLPNSSLKPCMRTKVASYFDHGILSCFDTEMKLILFFNFRGQFQIISNYIPNGISTMAPVLFASLASQAKAQKQKQRQRYDLRIIVRRVKRY